MADVGYLMDEGKLQRVTEAHSVTLSEIVEGCEDPQHLADIDPQGNPERYMIVGRTKNGRILQVLCSEEEAPAVRLITAFDANSFWRTEYNG